MFGNNIVDHMSPSGPVRLWDCRTEWAHLQPTHSKWHWDHLDGLVEQAGKRSILLVLGHPPEWAAKGGADGFQAAWMPPGSNRPPINDEVWSNYVVAVAQRYRGLIKHYQVWNEPVDRRFYTGEYDELAFLVKRTKSLISRTDPGARVVGPPHQPRRQAGWTTRGKRLLNALQAEGYPFDIYSMHIYPQIGEGVNAWIRDAKLVINILDAYNAPQKPLWVTETNFNLGGPGNPFPKARQDTIKQQLSIYSSKLGIPRIYWYAYRYSNPSLIGITNT